MNSGGQNAAASGVYSSFDRARSTPSARIARVVERQLTDAVDVDPFRDGRVRAGHRRGQVGQQGQVGDGDDAATWIAVRLAVRGQLL